MSEEPRRSGRATKGQHNKPSSSPAPNSQKPGKKGSKSKLKKHQEQDNDEGDDEDDEIRCICGNDNPDDKRAFIGCEACLVWQHNVCMGEAEDEDDVPEHYFCEQCRPEDHKETLAALASGDPIWEARNKLWKGWKKMSANRRKSKGKGGEETRPPWLKKDVDNAEEGSAEDSASAGAGEETGTKRKRESVKSEPEFESPAPEDEEPVRAARPDKRRKSVQAPKTAHLDPDTAVVDIDTLPADRQRIAKALSKIIAEDIADRTKSGFQIPEGHSTKSLGDRFGSLVEYALFMNYNGPRDERYKVQFQQLNPNLKRNKVLVERLLEGSLTPDELAVMESKDMASEEQQMQMKKWKEESDRQAVIVEPEGPKYRQSHKGIEQIEDERAGMDGAGGEVQPVRERGSMAGEGGAGSPPEGVQAASPMQSEIVPTGGGHEARRQSTAPSGVDRRTSSQQQFDMNNIWQKTGGSAQSPTSTTSGIPRPLQMPPRRRSSVHVPSQQQQPDGTKDDADVDRLLQDDEDDVYEPQQEEAYGNDPSIVWRGKLVHAGEGEPTVNARFVAGRDITSTAPWREILPSNLSVDGRLAVQKAEEYLCGLQWSHNSDVSVLQLTPHDDVEPFNRVFEYFRSRGRYAVVNRDKPGMVRDLYVIPVERGEGLPEHVQMLEFCGVGSPVAERVLLASFVVARAPGGVGGQADGAGEVVMPQQQQATGPPSGGQQQHLPQHIRAGGPGPAGSPISASNPTVASPSQAGKVGPPSTGYGAPQQQQQQQQQGTFPPNLYEQQHQQHQQPQPHANPLVAEILGPRQWDPSAVAIVAAEPSIDAGKLGHLRQILEEDVLARTNLEVLGMRLGAG